MSQKDGERETEIGRGLDKSIMPTIRIWILFFLPRTILGKTRDEPTWSLLADRTRVSSKTFIAELSFEMLRALLSRTKYVGTDQSVIFNRFRIV